MKCRDIKEKLSEYIDNTLCSEDRGQVESHLQTCSGCRALSEDLKRSVACTRRVGDVEPPAWLKHRVMARVREECRAKKGIIRKLFFPLHIKVPVEVIATLAVAVTAFYVFKSVEPEMKMAYAPAEQDMAAGRKKIKDLKKDEYPAETIPGYSMPEPAGELKARAGDSMVEAEKQLPPEPLAEATQAPEEALRESGSKAKEEFKRAAVGSESSPDALQPGVSLTVYVEDIKAAARDIETAITGLGGKVLLTESYEDKRVLVVEVVPEKAGELNKRLGQIGTFKDKDALSAAEGAELRQRYGAGIRIEIIREKDRAR